MLLPERYFLLVLKDASSIEEVDEESAVSEAAPPLVPPREDVGVGESGEEFQVGIREGKGFIWTKLVAINLSLSTLGHQVYKFRRCSPFGCWAKLRGHYVENLCNCSITSCGVYRAKWANQQLL